MADESSMLRIGTNKKYSTGKGYFNLSHKTRLNSVIEPFNKNDITLV